MSHPDGNTPIYSSSPDITNEVVEKYLLVPQNSDERPTWYASNDLYTGLATTLETDVSFNAFDFFLPVDGGPPLHYHVYENEIWYGIEGELSFSFGNEAGEQGVEPEYSITVPAETLVFGPRLLTHTYRNIDSTDATVGENVGARTLSFTTPGGLDLFFDYVGMPVEDRDDSIPFFGPPTPEMFEQLLEIGVRISGAPYFVTPEIDYVPPEDALDYVLVLPENPDPELVEAALNLTQVDEYDFSIWQIDNNKDIPLPTRPTFTGPFGIEYTSLLTLEESGNELAYNQFSLAPQDTETFAYADLSGSQVTEAVETSATGTATLQLNETGEIAYSLTVSGLDFGELAQTNTAQTPDNELDDVTGIHIHSSARGEDGPHAFDIFSLEEQHETNLNITLNNDGSTTIEGIWEQTEQEIPIGLIDFINSDNLPGTESDFYFQIHTEGNQEGEIRGQVALNTNDFPDPVKSENHEALYVKDGQLSLKIGNEVRLVEPETFVYIPPEQEYSLGNFGEETVDSLAVTVIREPELNSSYGNDRELSSPLDAQGDFSASKSVFLGDEADFFDNPNEDSRQVYGGDGNDELYANYNDRLFGENGDDILNAVTSNDNNRLDGGDGNDELLAGRNGVLLGGDGNDLLRIVDGDRNLLNGGGGEDRFWIINGRVPNTVPETRQLTEFGLPPLSDTRNVIADFELGVDKIGLGGIAEVSSFEDLKLLPAFDDIQSTSILVEIDGIEGEISLANVAGVQFNQFTAEDFIFA